MRQRQLQVIKRLMDIADKMEAVDGSKHAAAVVIRNRVVGLGTNIRKTHPISYKYGKNKEAIYLHAETHAIKNALRTISLKEMKRATLYVARVDRNSEMAMSKPCEGCERCIKDYGIKHVIYTTNEGIEQDKL